MSKTNLFSFYELKNLDLIKVENIVFLSTCSSAESKNKTVSARLLRHFNII
jgi:hypothetical protein